MLSSEVIIEKNPSPKSNIEFPSNTRNANVENTCSAKQMKIIAFFQLIKNGFWFDLDGDLPMAWWNSWKNWNDFIEQTMVIINNELIAQQELFGIFQITKYFWNFFFFELLRKHHSPSDSWEWIIYISMCVYEITINKLAIEQMKQLNSLTCVCPNLILFLNLIFQTKVWVNFVKFSKKKMMVCIFLRPFQSRLWCCFVSM